MNKSGIIDSILETHRAKQTQQLKKTDGSKSSRVSGISKLDDANHAGTRQAHKCTLILTEGDSAKALAVSGLSVVGRDYYGVFPLRGKLLNVRDASLKQVMDNEEISQLKKIMGLQHGKEYPTVDSLRYGRLMIMTDQDYDGSHIKGLIINFFDVFFPSLLRIPGFLIEFITPIVKATSGTGNRKKEVAFFTIPEYETWREANDNARNWTIKYYKGLGTSTSAEAKAYFSKLDLHRKVFASCEQEGRQLIDLAFSKKRADERKDWLRSLQVGTFIDHSAAEITIPDFVNKELILFSMADNIRSIPSLVDGFKPGQRKVLYGCFKRKLKNEIKVAQLAGYVAEHSAYHHGEQSLAMTIIGMAQDFVGANNINLLEPLGQFGTRLQGGKDAASSRYVFTVLAALSRVLFNENDDALLKYLDDDGQSIEPQYYVPVVPMILVNGSDGIGTGWRSSIPNYNPRDIVNNLRLMLRGEEPQTMHPWYRGFRGSTEQIALDKYRVTGIYSRPEHNKIEVTELPVGVWTQSYKEMLEEMMVVPSGSSENAQPPLVKDFKEHHTDTKVRFTIDLTPEGVAAVNAEGVEAKFKLSTTISTSNLVCFDKENRIRKYTTPIEILQEFFELRLDYYRARKSALLDKMQATWTRLDNKARFIMAVVEGKLVIAKRKKDEIIADLTRLKFTPLPTKAANGTRKAEPTEDDDEESADTAPVSFNYLLSMPLWSLTHEKVQQLMKEKSACEAEIKELTSKSHKDLWSADLDAFEAAWDAFPTSTDVRFAFFSFFFY